MDIGLLIDGDKRDASGAAAYERMDPFTGKLATRAAAASVADANAAVDAAAAAFTPGRRPDPASAAPC